mmetsp:Transcript_22873/g.20336  ORF Transcript_22873/g.20336 Transcript_22873/m.20336 type:complete len:161 (-) Transcript_22873:17-499(-)
MHEFQTEIKKLEYTSPSIPSMPLSSHTMKNIPRQLRPKYLENPQKEDDYETELRENEVQIDNLLKTLKRSKKKILKRCMPLLKNNENQNTVNESRSTNINQNSIWNNPSTGILHYTKNYQNPGLMEEGKIKENPKRRKKSKMKKRRRSCIKSYREEQYLR